MLGDQSDLRKATDQIVANMVAAGMVERRFYRDERVGKEYPNLITPNAFDKKLIAIAVLGYPELVGVWSYTLLGQSRVSESSMEPYFHEFNDHDLGLVAINPNYFDPDIEGGSFIYQIEKVVGDITIDKKIVFIGFSMGGKILVEFLEQHYGLLSRAAGLVLIDPTLPNRLSIGNMRQLLDNDTLLVASEGEIHSPGEIASLLLEIPKTSFPGIHGEMPNKALPKVIRFCEERKP